MPVVAELRNVIIGDDTNWRAAAARTEASLIALQQKAETATAAISGAFSGMAGPLTGVTTSFQNVGTQATTSFNQVQQAAGVVPPTLASIATQAEVMGATIASNGNGASAAMGGIAAASNGAAQSVASMGAAAVSAGTGVAELTAKKAILEAELLSVNAAIRNEASALVSGREALASYGGSQQQLSQAVASSEASLGGYIAKQSLLKSELSNVSGALKAATTAQTATNTVQGAAAATTQDLGQKTGILSALFSAHTTQITSQGTAWKGYDNVIQAVIRSMGGIPVVWALAITVAGVLLEKLIHLGDAKKEQIKLDQDQIQLDQQRWQSMATGTLFTQQYATVLHDVNAIHSEVKRTTEDALVAQANEADAIRKSSTAASDYAAATSDLQLKIVAYAMSLFGSTEAETKATAARIEATKAQADAVAMEIRAAAQSGKTIEQLIAERQAAGATSSELSLLASAWGTATAARATYEAGRSALGTLKLELAQAAAQRGEVLQGANALRVLKDAIAGLPPEQRKLVEQSQLTERSLNALNKTTDQHARSAGVARSAVSQYAEGVVGLSKAFDTVTASLRSGVFDKLFDDLPTKARKGLDSIKQAAQTVIKELTDLLKHATPEGGLKFGFDDKDLKPAISTLKVLGETGVAESKKITEAFKTVEEQLLNLKIAAINLKQPIFEIPFTALYNDMGKLTTAGEKMSEAIKNAGGVIKVTFTDVSKAVSESAIRQVDSLNVSADEVENWSNQWVKSLGKAKAELSPFEQALQEFKRIVEVSFDFERLQNDIAQQFRNIAGEFEQLGETLGRTQEETNAKILAAFGRLKDSLPAELQSIAAAAERTWADGINKLPGALDGAVNKMLTALGVFAAQSRIKVKGAVDGVLLILDAIPGKLHNIAQSFIDWVNRIDQILRGLHKIFDQIPDGLGAALSQVIGIFRQNSATIQTTATTVFTAAGQAAVGGLTNAITNGTEAIGHSIGGTLAAAGDKAAQSASQAGAQVGGSVAQGIASALGGVASGAVIYDAFLKGIQTFNAGFQDPSKMKRFMSGLSLGLGPALISLFFGGPSPLQKAQMEAQLQQAKDAIKLSQQQVLQATEQTKQSMLETAGKIRELLEAITFYTQIPKDAFNAFFHDLDKLMDKFAARAEEWINSSSDKIKAFSEAMQQVVSGLENVPKVFEGIGAHLGVSDASINRFFDDLGKVLVAFEAKSEEFSRKFLRHARQFAERIQEAVGILPDIISGITGLVDIKPVPLANFDIFEQSLTEVTNRIGTIATNFDKYTAKLIGFFATQVGPAVTLWKDAIDAIKAMADLTAPSAESFAALFAGIQAVLDGMSNLATTIESEALTRAQAIAVAADAIFGSIKSGVEALTALADFKGVAPEAFQALLDGFDQAIAILNQLLTKATQFESVAMAIEDKLKSAAKHMANGVSAMAATLAAASSAIGSSAPSVPPSSTVGISSAGLTIAPGAAPSSSSSSTVVSAPVSVSLTIGTLVGDPMAVQDMVIDAIQAATRRGRLGIGWGDLAHTT